MITTITGKNQVTIPAKLVHELDIQPGQRLEWSLREDGDLTVRILPSRADLARKAAGMGKSWLKPGQDPVAELIEERAQSDREEGLA